jgi:hypothetical protein
LDSYTKQKKTGDRGRPEPRIALRVTGFGQQNRVSVARIVAAIDALPRFHLQGLHEIEYDPYRLTQKARAYFPLPGEIPTLPDPSCQGEFVHDENKILVYPFESLESLLRVLYHEIGHHVFHRVIGSALKQHWVTRIKPGTAPTTDYGARNANEDFAETYAIYLLDPSRLYRIPEKHRFMRDKVFNSSPTGQ